MSVIVFPKIRSFEVPQCEFKELSAQDIVSLVLAELAPTEDQFTPVGGAPNVKEKDRHDLVRSSETVWTRQQMMSGSLFEGEVNFLNMNGEARYIMPHGVLFEGAMADGMFEGRGVLKYPNGSALYGIWDQGRLVKIRKYVYGDGFSRDLDDPDKFDYCVGNDRRFHWETLMGIGPGRKALLTNHGVPRHIPGKYYDVLDGYLDLSIKWILDRDTLQPIRHATTDEIKLAITDCRKGWHEYTGYRPDTHVYPEETPDAIHPTKFYKQVPGFDPRKKQFKLERKIAILKYKINHDIATPEDIALYEKLTGGGVTLSMVSSEPTVTPESGRSRVTSGIDYVSGESLDMSSILFQSPSKKSSETKTTTISSSLPSVTESDLFHHLHTYLQRRLSSQLDEPCENQSENSITLRSDVTFDLYRAFPPDSRGGNTEQ
ncbi:hypothetical protein M8J76_004087 [Diaphorina citri]|nr:hypothetical protein M8J76_004087 [Diaphorina citri]